MLVPSRLLQTFLACWIDTLQASEKFLAPAQSCWQYTLPHRCMVLFLRLCGDTRAGAIHSKPMKSSLRQLQAGPQLLGALKTIVIIQTHSRYPIVTRDTSLLTPRGRRTLLGICCQKLHASSRLSHASAVHASHPGKYVCRILKCYCALVTPYCRRAAARLHATMEKTGYVRCTS